MNTGRRFKRFRLAPADLCLLLKGKGLVTGFPLPDDAAIYAAGWDANCQMLLVMVWSAEFGAVEPDREVPFTTNVPIIEEIA